MYRFYIYAVGALLMNSACTSDTVNGVSASNQKFSAKKLITIASIPAWQRKGHNAIFYETGLKIDADGSPRAYHPEEKGLDFNYNGGTNGEWWGVATNDHGEPIVQGSKDPYPGYYVSSTSLTDRTKQVNDPARYVNAEEIPYIVLPKELSTKASVQLGDFAAVINKVNGRIAYAIFADVGPPEKLGEGSIYLTNELDINSSPKYGGADDGIIFIVFAGSGNGHPRSKEEIAAEGQLLLNEWGGKDLLMSFFKGKQLNRSEAYNKKKTENDE